MNNSEFEKRINYEFEDKELLEKALTHSSFGREHGVKSKGNNERLEFLGDAFFDAVISVELYKRLPDDNEGKLSKTRAQVVCEESLAMAARRLDMGRYINMGRGEELSGGRDRESILADSVEAVVGAVFLDGGYDAASSFIMREFKETVEKAIAGNYFTDYKTKVQELLQSGGRAVHIVYELDREEGPDHDKTFYVHLTCNGQVLGKGSGKSKKEAEQNAAKSTLERGIENYVF